MRLAINDRITLSVYILCLLVDVNDHDACVPVLLLQTESPNTSLNTGQ